MGTADCAIRIQLLGGFRVWVGNQAIDDRAWKLRKARALLKVLALAPGHWMHQEQLLALLWPDLPPRAAANNLHQTLHAVRQVLRCAVQSDQGTATILLKEHVLSLHAPAGLWVDVEAFEQSAEAAEKASDISACEEALRLYGGELLPEDRNEEWAAERREFLHHCYASLLRGLGRLYEVVGDLPQAFETLKRAVAAEPTAEEAHADLMRVYARSGKREEAVQQFHRLREVLGRQLGVEPDAETTQLHEDIREGRFPSDQAGSLFVSEPVTRYARPGEVHVAYHLTGEGPRDLLLVPDGMIPIESMLEEPSFRHFIRRLERFCRVIRFDPRGMGLSDPVAPSNPPTLEQWTSDAEAVLEASGSGRTALLGMAEGGFVAALLAATRPQRASALILINATPGFTAEPFRRWGLAAGAIDRLEATVGSEWGGEVAWGIPLFAPSAVNDDAYRRWLIRTVQQSLSPAGWHTVFDVMFRSDIRNVLPVIRVPTLVIHRRGNRYLEPAHGRYLADHILGARYVEVAGDDHVPYLGDAGAILDEIEEFLTGVRRRPQAGPDPGDPAIRRHRGLDAAGRPA